MTANNFSIAPIGRVQTQNGFSIIVDEEYRQGLSGLEGFSHIVVLWLAHETDEGHCRIKKPYVEGPEEIGVFSTRSASRPNRLGLSMAPLISLDPEEGILQLAWIDTHEGTPVMDIKPYYPSSDRVVEVSTPSWCSEWPQNLEESATFDWESVFS